MSSRNRSPQASISVKVASSDQQSSLTGNEGFFLGGCGCGCDGGGSRSRGGGVSLSSIEGEGEGEGEGDWWLVVELPSEERRESWGLRRVGESELL